MKEQLPGLLRVVLDRPLHLLHELKHLLRRETGHSLCNSLRGCLRGNGGTMDGWLGGRGGGGEEGKERGREGVERDDHTIAESLEEKKCIYTTVHTSDLLQCQSVINTHTNPY